MVTRTLYRITLLVECRKHRIKYRKKWGIQMNLRQIKKISNGLINTILIPFIVLAILGALSLILPNFLAMNSSAVKLTFVVIFIGLLSVTVAPIKRLVRKTIKWCYSISYPHRRIIIGIIIFVTVCWQIAVIYLISGENAHDLGLIMHAAVEGVGPNQIYFSMYPNTILFFFIEHGWWLVTGKPVFENFVVYFNLINLILLDGGILMLGNVVRRLFGKKYLPVLFVLGWLILLISPWVAEPYSDTWAFFITALCLDLGVVYHRTNKTKVKYLVAITAGIVLTWAYLIKPTLVITFIAVGIIYLLRSLGSGQIRIHKIVVVSALLFMVGLGTSFTIYQSFLHRQNIIQNNTKIAHPMVHFVAMGMTGNGGYNTADTEMDLKIKSPIKRRQKNIKLIRQRLKGFQGVTNYGKFLIQKQINNTADGSFSWGSDIVTKTNQSNSVTRNRTIIRKLYAKEGQTQPNTFEYRFFAQLVWSASLILILFTIKLDSWRIQFFKYGIVGFMLFLLIFEGGRSRYVIQFLPLVLVLATVGSVRLHTIMESYRLSMKHEN